MCIFLPEQKVNEKNSWNLDLINHLDRVIDEPSADGEGEMTNFQRASCTLEAGIKIYSYRVDSVYTETFKLMGGLNRTSKRDGQADDQDVEADAPEDGADGPSVQKKEKTSKRVAASAGTAFLEANPAALSLKKLELAFDVDPLFHRTSAKFDEGGAKGLLLHNLPVQHGCALVFDSSDAERPAAATAAAPALPLRCISNLLPRACLELHISSEFSEQHEPAACDWALGGRAVSGLAPHSGDSDDEDAADEPAADGPDHFDDDAPFAPPDNDDEPFDEVPMDDRDELLQQAQQGDGEGRLAILSLDEMMSEREGELEQGDEQAAAEDVHQKAQQMLQVGQRWAGPAHWKFHAAPKARAAEGGGGGGGGGRAGKAKSAFVLDFRNRAEALQAVLAMPLEAKGTTLSEAALSKAIEADNTLPNDHHCRQRRAPPRPGRRGSPTTAACVCAVSTR